LPYTALTLDRECGILFELITRLEGFAITSLAEVCEAFRYLKDLSLLGFDMVVGLEVSKGCWLHCQVIFGVCQWFLSSLDSQV
jgi:hypothetical protein